MIKRSALAVAAVALTTVSTVGATAPAASAAAAGHGQTAAVGPVDLSKKGPKAPLTVEKRKVLSLIAHKDAGLGKVAKKLVSSGLAGTVADAVAANVTGDRLTLSELTPAVGAATTLTEVREIGDRVRHVHPSVYSAVVDGLSQVATFEARVAANTAAVGALTTLVDAKALEGFDTTAVVDLLLAATTANEQAAVRSAAAASKGLALTAFSTAEERAAFGDDVLAAEGLLDNVDLQLQTATDSLTAMVPVDSPVTEVPLG